MTIPDNNLDLPRQRHKLVPTTSMPAGSSERYHRKLSAHPSTYFVPLTDGAWSEPSCGIAGNCLTFLPASATSELYNHNHYFAVSGSIAEP